MKTRILLILSCSIIFFCCSCKKDYTCACNISYDNGDTETTEWLMDDWSSKEKAEKDCKSDDGDFEYTDLATGILVTGSKSCELE